MTADVPVRQRFLPLGDFYFGGDPLRIQTVLGTCVSITLWHPGRHLGGMCHYLLPTRGGSGSTSYSAPGVYADEVMELVEAALRRTATRPQDYVVKLFGGGHMFPGQLRDLACRDQACTDALRRVCASVGCKNICAGRQMLADRGFRIAMQNVGGHGSRQILFDVWSGDVWVRQGNALGALAEAI
jgi:chemotaxis protein CheD